MKIQNWKISDYQDWEDDPVLAQLAKQKDTYTDFRRFALNTMKKYGAEDCMWNRVPEEAPEYVEGNDYSNYHLGLMADEILRADVKTELCRKCQEPGEQTEKFKWVAQFDKDGKTPILNEEEKQLQLKFYELKCENRHKWWQGDGRSRGIGGDNPILFEEHLQSRKRREINPAEGVPDPAIVSGIYNRSHPQGRKVNTIEQRRSSGASYYR